MLWGFKNVDGIMRLLIIVLTLVFFGVWFALDCGEKALEPKAVTEHEFLTPEVNEVGASVVVEEVEVIREVAVHLCEFKDVQELIDWLAQDDTDEIMHIARRMDSSLNCVDCADMLIERAREAGKDVYYQSVDNGYQRRDTGEIYTTAHGLCATRIGDVIFYIEPKDDGVWAARYAK